MKKSHIKKLLKLEKVLEKELHDIYVESMLELFPIKDYQNLEIPCRKTIISMVKQKIYNRHEELKESKIVIAAISNVVNKKYEVLKR